MNFNSILNGSGMKCSTSDIYSIIDTHIESTAVKVGSVSERIGFDEFNIEYLQYFNALARLMIIMRNNLSLLDKEVTGFGGIAIDHEHGWIYAEYCDASLFEYNKSSDFTYSNKTLLKIGLYNFDVYANTVDGKTGAIGKYMPTPNKAKAGERNGCAALFAYLVWLKFAECELSSVEKILNQELNDAIVDLRNNDNAIALMFDLQNITRKSDLVIDEFGDCPNLEAIQPMFKSFCEKDHVIFQTKQNKDRYGDFKGFSLAWGTLESNATSSNSHALKDLIGKFDFNTTRVRTLEEQRILNEMRKSLDGDMYVSDEVIRIATDIKLSTNLKFKFRNYMLKGPAGTGKTTMCKVLGLLLNLPVVTFSCDPDTDQLALGCSVIPNGSSKGDEAEKVTLESFMKSMPCTEEFIFDASSSYENITGKHKEDASPDDCMVAILQKWGEVSENQSKGFRYVYSNIARAMKNGWIVEVQEPTVIQRPGVLTALNALTDDCGKMDLVNGETIYRHPDAVMIYTTNLNFEGCFDMNQSQKSRFSQRTINLPDENELVSRLMESTKFNDEKVARKMVKVYMLADNYAKSKGIYDGTIDFRGLQAWATANIIHKNTIYENGVTEFIEKCTDDPAQKSIFITSCLETQFSPSKVEKSKINDLRPKF